MRFDVHDFKTRLDNLQRPEGATDADMSLARGLLTSILSILRGQVEDAENNIVHLLHSTQGERWRRRLVGYLSFARSIRFYPPLFRYKPRVSSPTTLLNMIENPDLAAESETAMTENCGILMMLDDDKPADLDVLEQFLLLTIWNLSHTALSASQAINPNFRFENLQKPVPSLEEQQSVVLSTVDVLRSLRSQFRLVGLPIISNYVSRLLFELEDRSCLPSAEASFRRLRDDYTNDKDETGIAICDMMEADRALCGPFSSPIALNLPLVENWTIGPSNFPVGKLSSLLQLGYDGTIEYDLTDASMSSELSLHQVIRSHMVVTDIGLKTETTKSGEEYVRASIEWEKVSQENTEFLANETGSKTASTPNATDIFIGEEAFNGAERLYRRTEALMRRSSSSRGLAAVKLRQGCTFVLSKMARLAPSGNITFGEAVQLLKEAAASFDESGDISSWYLALVLGYLAGNQTPRTHKDLGRLAVLEGNSEIFVQYLGLLALRFGDFYQHRVGQMSLAFHGYIASRRIFTALALQKPRTHRHLATVADLSDLSLRLQFGWQQVPRKEISSMFEGLVELAQSLPVTVGDGSSISLGPITWSIVFLIEQFVQCIAELSISSGTLTQDEESSLSSIVGQVTPHLEFLPNLASYLGQMNHRYKLIAEYLRLHSQWHRSTFDGSVQDLNGTQRSLQSLAKRSLESRELWASTILLCGQISVETAHCVMASGSSTILGSIDPWPNNVVWSVFGSEWFTAYGRFLAVEQSLEGAVAMKNWPYARDLMQILERLAPGYFSRHLCASKTPAWRRALLAALVEDGLGSFENAIRLSLAALGELFVSLEYGFSDVDDRSAFLSNLDMSRVPNLCAKILVKAREKGHVLSLAYVSSTPPPPDDHPDRRKHWGKFPFLEGPLRLPEIEGYAWSALFHLESLRASSLYEQLQLSADVNESRQEWSDARYKFALLHQLKSATRPLSPGERHELDVLESDQENLAWNRIRTNNSLRKRQQDLAAVDDVEYIPGNALVIYTALSTEGLTAIALCWQGMLKAVFIEEANLQLIGRTIAVYLATVRDGKETANPTTLIEISFSLSKFLIAPFEEFVEVWDHIIFVPSGPLTQFPLGTLFFKEDSLVTQKAVSQVPSLSYLKYLSTRPPKHRSPEKINVAVVARPGSVREEALGGERALPLAGIEAAFVSMFHKESARKAQDVLHRDLDELLGHSILHVATHGYIDASAPLLSRISLGEPTRVVDIFASPSRADVVIFSACNTATGLQSPGENFTGFSQAILAAGADLFIGSLWPTDDLATMLHMVYFYTYLFSGVDENIATTWHRATARLVDTTTEVAKAKLEWLIELWGEMEQQDRTPDHVVKKGQEKLRRAIKRLEKGCINLRHPYFWAPFILYGYSEIRMQLRVPPASP